MWLRRESWKVQVNGILAKREREANGSNRRPPPPPTLPPTTSQKIRITCLLEVKMDRALRELDPCSPIPVINETVSQIAPTVTNEVTGHRWHLAIGYIPRQFICHFAISYCGPTVFEPQTYKVLHRALCWFPKHQDGCWERKRERVS